MIELNAPLVVVDVETTGTNPETDRIVQIGIIKLYPDGKKTEWETLVNPEMPIPPEIGLIHGITNETVRDAPKFSEIAHNIVSGMKMCDYCGYNVKFDLKFLEAEIQRAGIKFTFNGRILDGLRIFQTKERRDLTAAVKFYLKEDLSGAHNALTDARATLRVVEAQLEHYPDLPRTMEELHVLFFETVTGDNYDPDGKFIWRNSECCINFGKHKGKPLRDLPIDYIQWMLKGDFSQQVKILLAEAAGGKFPTRQA